MAASDEFKKEMLKCLNGQDEFSEFASTLKKAIVHELPALSERADDTEKKLRNIHTEVDKFRETHNLIAKMSEEFHELGKSMLEMITNQKRDTIDAGKLADRLMKVEDGKVESDKKLTRIGTRQNMYMSIAAALCMAVLSILIKLYTK